MKPIQDKYPIFEANQVLTSRHLNEVFDYLNEQERLTRANLIGIGIECGLEIRLETNGNVKTIHLSHGCGVSSAGYILIEPEDLDLVSYQKYTLPLDIDYPQFKYESAGISVQFPLWELFPKGEPNTVLLGNINNFLDDKVVILFLELKNEGLRNCSPNNCDDKGNEVTATVKPLLIEKGNLEKIIAKANKLGTEYTATDLESVLLARLNLPDLRLPRYNVPNTAPVSSNDVLAAFHAVFQKNKLATNTGDALTATYKAFMPLVIETFPGDPFADFDQNFGFLDGIPTSTSQVRFLPYYFDFFDDLIQAYDEFRWKAASLMCACCPPEDLFPRHLMLGMPDPSFATNPGIYRHDFLSSPAIKGCEERKAEVIQLFSRLVEMVNNFTNNPTPPVFANFEVARKLMPVRITPSKLADVPISQKAIPYYYLQDGVPPLFQLWNVEKTRRNRANQNLSFRSDEYLPKAPIFVTAALKYDLEPYNFLRIEGHLGKKVVDVMDTLIAFKTDNRLPIDIIALRTGEFDARQAVDLSKEVCHFEDLEAIYDAFRDQFISSLGKTLASFYTRKISKVVSLADDFKASLIHSINPDFKVEPSTFGALLETHFASLSKSKTTKTAVLKRVAAVNIKDAFLSESAVIQATASYAEVLLDICNYLKDRLLSGFDLTAFRDLFNRLETLNAQFKTQINTADTEWNSLFNLLEAVRYANEMEAFRSIGEEYRKRLIEIKKQLFLSNYLLKNPGIQHKAGVPMGGTFILVYHDDPTPIRLLPNLAAGINSMKANFTKVGFATDSSETITKAFERLQVKGDAAQVDPDIQLILSEMSKQIVKPDFEIGKGIRIKTAEKIIAETVNEFADGTVIADFYLPYICCSDCSPIQYIMAKDPLNFSVNIGCNSSDKGAKVIVTPWGGTAPYKLKINNEDFKDQAAELLLKTGKYTLILRDSEGTLSDSQQIEIVAPLTLGLPNFDCGDGNQYVAVIEISGGTPPYTANKGKILNDKTFFGESLPGNTNIEIIITDSRKCTASVVLNHSCIPDLAFSVNIGCTSSKNEALVEILPTGGVEPYEFQIGQKDFAPLQEAVTLPSGLSTITVRDSVSTKVQQDITVPATLALIIVEFINDPRTKAYQARIQVSGGSAPYKSSTGKQISENEFITDPIPAGESGKFEVVDSKNCSFGTEIQNLSFTVNIECTNADDQAKVVVTPVGGTAPFKLKINDEDFKDLIDENFLSAGKYVLILSDSKDLLSASQQIEIPAHLSIGEPGFDCVGDNNEYVASFLITGGTQPYTAQPGNVSESNYFSNPLPGNTDIDIIVTDSRNCSATITINHSCVSDLTFSTTISCTSANNEAMVEIIPSGGVVPYQFQVGTNPVTTLSEAIALSPGTYSITLFDSVGTSVSNEVTIPAMLELNIAEFICDKETKTYTARIQVSGGTAPYKSKAGEITSENEFVTNPIPDGELIIFEVVDGKKCSRSIEVQHICDEPCQLPCEGQSRKCAYRLWLQPPVDGTEYIEYNQLENLKLRYNGKPVDLPDANQLLQIPVDALNKNFVNAMTQTIGKLNEIIRNVLNEMFGDVGKTRLAITYEPSEGDPFGILWIEYFVCESFNLEFDYMFQKPEQDLKLRFRYTNEPDEAGNPFNGTISTNFGMNNERNVVPAFDCRERNQCVGSDFANLCLEKIGNPDFSIRQMDNSFFNLTSITKNKTLVSWVWDIINTTAQEPFYTGESLDAIIPKPIGIVRLTVINKNGCFAFIDKGIEQ